MYMLPAVLCTIDLFLLMRETYGNIIVAPSNVAVLHGEKSTFECITDVKQRRLIWLTTDLTSEEIAIWSGYTLSDDFEGTAVTNMTVEGQCDLIIKGATKLVAKRYICKEPGTLQKRSAELVVFESEPECISVKTFSNLNITCTVKYTGNWPPTMEWLEFDGKQNRTVTPMIYVTNNRVTSRLLIDSSGIVSSRSYFVTTKFSEKRRPQETNATNIPEYSFTNVIPYFVDDDTEVERSIQGNLGLYALLVVVPLIASIFIVVIVIVNKKRERKRIELQKNHNSNGALMAKEKESLNSDKAMPTDSSRVT